MTFRVQSWDIIKLYWTHFCGKIIIFIIIGIICVLDQCKTELCNNEAVVISKPREDFRPKDEYNVVDKDAPPNADEEVNDKSKKKSSSAMSFNTCIAFYIVYIFLKLFCCI